MDDRKRGEVRCVQARSPCCKPEVAAEGHHRDHWGKKEKHAEHQGKGLQWY